jgi:hypothetical protein
MKAVARCTVCNGRALADVGARYDPDFDVVTWFATCRTCGARYLFKRAATREERANTGDRLPFPEETPPCTY